MNNAVFILGMPRSGTKLLRTILNNNKNISIPNYETLFVPRFIAKYGLHPNFNEDNISDIISDIKFSTFYFNAKKGGFFLNEEHFKKNIDYNSLLSIIKYILTNFAEKKGDDIIWGDKTPSYINDIDLLNRSFPESKFIHIIRDSRDNAISANKAWNKNIYRVAQRWNESIVNFNEYIVRNEVNLLEIKFEDLLDNPRMIISNICDFLNVDFEDQMLILKKSSENLGDAKNKNEIISSNKNKFTHSLSKKKIKKIEELTYNGMTKYNYDLIYGQNQIHLRGYRMVFYKFLDVLYRFIFNLRNYGLLDGIKYSFNSFKKFNR